MRSLTVRGGRKISMKNRLSSKSRETYCSWAFHQSGYCSIAQCLEGYEYHHSSQS